MGPPGITLWSGTWEVKCDKARNLQRESLYFAIHGHFRLGAILKFYTIHIKQTRVNHLLLYCHQHFVTSAMVFFSTFSQSMADEKFPITACAITVMFSKHFYDIKLASTHVTLQERVKKIINFDAFVWIYFFVYIYPMVCKTLFV